MSSPSPKEMAESDTFPCFKICLRLVLTIFGTSFAEGLGVHIWAFETQNALSEGVFQCPSAWNDLDLTVASQLTIPSQPLALKQLFLQSSAAHAASSRKAPSRPRASVPSATAKRGSAM